MTVADAVGLNNLIDSCPKLFMWHPPLRRRGDVSQAVLFHQIEDLGFNIDSRCQGAFANGIFDFRRQLSHCKSLKNQRDFIEEPIPRELYQSHK